MIDPVRDPEMHLIQECAELQQAVCKARQFGWGHSHIGAPEATNYDAVMREMDDVVQAIERLQEVMRAWKHNYYSKADVATEA